MSLLITALMGFVLGIGTIFVGPFLGSTVKTITEAFGIELKITDKIMDRYRSMAMASFGRCLCVKRRNAGFKFVKSSYENGVETATIGGQKMEWIDPLNNMGRLYGRPFAFAHEDSNIIGSPAAAKVCEKIVEKAAEDNLVREDLGDGGEAPVWGIIGFGSSELVDMDYWARLTQGSADPRIGIRVESFIEKMFKQWDSRRVAQWTIWFLSAGMGAALPWLGQKLETSGGGTSIEVPMYLTGVIL